MKRPESTTSARRDFSSARSGSYCACTSMCGISGTRRGSGRAAAHHRERRESEDARGYDHVHVTKVVVEAVVARAEGPASAGEAEAEAGAADEGEREEAGERQADDPGRNGDERSEPRGQEAERDGEQLVALEPPLDAVELLRGDVQPAAVALEQRPATVIADEPADSCADRVPQDSR